jgi:hypothetical protein
MTLAHDRGARRERQAAKALGVSRVRRRGERAPDVTALRLPDASVLQCEVKTRKRLPKLVLDALAQAERYSPSAIPIAVISQTGGGAIVCVKLADFVRLIGVKSPAVGEQLALLARAT